MLNPKASAPYQLALSALIAALAVAFWCVRTARRRREKPPAAP